MSCVGRACNIGSVCHASVVRGYVPLSASSSLFYHFWFLKHHHSAATPHQHNRWETPLSYPSKLHACRANNNYFLYIFFFLLSVFVIVFNCIIQNNSYCLHWQYFWCNYLWQMHQIIHLSPVGCFTPARGKTVQKNREVSGVNDPVIDGEGMYGFKCRGNVPCWPNLLFIDVLHNYFFSSFRWFVAWDWGLGLIEYSHSLKALSCRLFFVIII